MQVQDTGSPQLSALSMATVTVDITDVNDCPPQFSRPEYSATLLLPTYNNVSVIQVGPASFLELFLYIYNQFYSETCTQGLERRITLN